MTGLPASVGHVICPTLMGRARELDALAAASADGRCEAVLVAGEAGVGIAPKTAAAHVSHILDKLGFSSRAQIARWVAEQREN